ncbi:MAG: phosphoribosyl-ATP pyrophosphatase [Bergeyella zoohelcum]|nr:phosphoribosyl-ATP pyrophosphatase [Bergeyella zoohelcum]
MGKYSSLEELRRQKEALKKEVSDLESLMKFEDKRASLSAITNGFTDNFLTEKINDNGEKVLSLKTGNVVKEVSNFVSNKNKKNSVVAFDNTNLQSNLIQGLIRVGGVAFIGSLAKKKLMGKGWKSKVLGFAIAYLLPIASKFIQRKVDDYQRKKSISSMQKLI